jgi:hypothetical protein
MEGRIKTLEEQVKHLESVVFGRRSRSRSRSPKRRRSRTPPKRETNKILCYWRVGDTDYPRLFTLLREFGPLSDTNILRSNPRKCIVTFETVKDRDMCLLHTDRILEDLNDSGKPRHVVSFDRFVDK